MCSITYAKDLRFVCLWVRYRFLIPIFFIISNAWLPQCHCQTPRNKTKGIRTACIFCGMLYTFSPWLVSTHWTKSVWSYFIRFLASCRAKYVRCSCEIGGFNRSSSNCVLMDNLSRGPCVIDNHGWWIVSTTGVKFKICPPFLLVPHMYAVMCIPADTVYQSSMKPGSRVNGSNRKNARNSQEL